MVFNVNEMERRAFQGPPKAYLIYGGISGIYCNLKWNRRQLRVEHRMIEWLEAQVSFLSK